MAFRLNDVSSNHAFLYLRNSQKTLAESLSRMSSGKSITKAADDAAGMTIVTSLESQVRGFGQSMRNATDAIAIVQVADGVMEKSADIIMSIRMSIRGKALQAANDSQTYQTRQALQADIGKTLTAFSDIAGNASYSKLHSDQDREHPAREYKGKRAATRDSTWSTARSRTAQPIQFNPPLRGNKGIGLKATWNYNGQKLLSGQFSNRSFQVDASSGETVEMNIGNASPATLGNVYGNLADINVLSNEGVRQALSVTDSALADINSMRSELGSTQNQLTATINNLLLTQLNVALHQQNLR
jgi:flagellin